MEGRKKERRKKENGRDCPILPESHVRLVGAIHEGITPTDMARLDRRGTMLASVAWYARVSPMSHASAHATTPS
jgi:hypothetical protein